MIVLSFDAECINQNTAPDIAGLSRDPRFCVGITGEMSEEAREILEAQHVPVRVGNSDKVQMAPPLLLWSRPRGDDKAKTLKKIRQRIPQVHQFWHVVGKSTPLHPRTAPGWSMVALKTLAEKLKAAA